MNRARRKRLIEVSQDIESRPLAPEVLNAAFERFCECGELPEHRRLAVAVVERTLDRPDQPKERPDLKEGIRRLMVIVEQWESDTLPSKPPDIRKMLLHEAVHCPASTGPHRDLTIAA